MAKTSSVLFSGGLFLLACVVGCGSDVPEIVPVSGTVTRGGKPVANIFLNFVPATGRPSWGVSDAEGKFSLHYDRDYEGAVTGKHKVFVQYKPANMQAELDMQAGKLKRPPELEEILKKYGTPEDSTKEVEITKKVTDLELKLD
jgi:hypothetical protein